MKNFSWVSGGTFVKFLTIFFVKKTTSPYISLYHNYQKSKIKNLNPHTYPHPYPIFHFIYHLYTLLIPPPLISYPLINKNPVEAILRGSIHILYIPIFRSHFLSSKFMWKSIFEYNSISNFV